MTLNMVWARAARWALMLLEPMVASSAVMVVPIFSPSTRAMAPGKVSNPWLARVMVRPMVADEDCTMKVRPAPTTTHSSSPPTELGSNLVKNARNVGSLLIGESPSFMTVIP